MNETPTLDDFEHAIIHTLHIKADQLVVDDQTSFDPDIAPPLLLIRQGTPEVARPHRGRRILAAAAALAVVVGGAAVVRNLGSDDAGDTETTFAAQSVVWSPRADDTAAWMPNPVPEGFTLADVNAGGFPGTVSPGDETTWQLFAADAPSPLAQGVLVGSRPNRSEGLSGTPTQTVQGEPAFVGPSTQPLVPAGAIELEWANGDVFHQVVAVGMTEAEVVDFLDSLVARAEREAGFDAGDDTPLPELDAVTTGDQLYMSYAAYTGPEGVGDLTVMAYSSDFSGGLLHRLVGEQRADGTLVRTGSAVSLYRTDGWTLDVSAGSALGPSWLDTVLGSIEPVTQQQLVDLGVAQPVTATATVDGWAVEFHGTADSSLAMCLTPAGGTGRVCSTAQGGPALTAGSVLVDGEWIVVVLADGSTTATIETTPNWHHGQTEEFDPETLHGETEGDVELVHVPADAEAVTVMIPTGENSATGYGFDRPDA